MANQTKVWHNTHVEFYMKEDGTDEVSEMIMDKLIDYALQLYKEAGKPIEQFEMGFETDYGTWTEEELQAAAAERQKLQDFYNSKITINGKEV